MEYKDAGNEKIDSKTALIFHERAGKVTVEGLQQNCAHVEIPAYIDGCPITGIEKKAFFNNRFLRSAILPDTIEDVGDWAFAHCPQLQFVELPQKEIKLGKGIFLGCGQLAGIALRLLNGAIQKETGFAEQLAVLLAAAITGLEAEYLLSVNEAGSKEWLQKWDSRLLTVMNRPDNEGFTRQVLCGEEDYGSTDQGRYENKRRREKARLAMLRLLHPVGMSEETGIFLETYLREHTGGSTNPEAWEVIRTEFAQQRRYYELFTRIGCVTPENFDGLLLDLQEEQPELKAYLLRYREEELGRGDFFESFMI